MIDPKYENLIDSTKNVNEDATLVAGRPVTLNSDGEIIAADGTSDVYGLSKIEKNAYLDESYSSLGEYGSRKGTVVIEGLCEVKPSTFQDSDLQTDEAELAVYDDEQSYEPMDDLYVDDDGLLTNVVSASGVKVGKVTKAPTASDDTMELILRIQ